MSIFRRKKEPTTPPLDESYSVVSTAGTSQHNCYGPAFNRDDATYKLGKGSIIRCLICLSYSKCYNVDEYGMWWRRVPEKKVAKLTTVSNEGVFAITNIHA